MESNRSQDRFKKPSGSITVIGNVIEKHPHLASCIKADISTIISPGDGMYDPTQEEYYFVTGLWAVYMISRILDYTRKPMTEVRHILDFACGHGRVTRALRAAFPSSRITVCDTDRKGVEFCASTFNAELIYSSKETDRIKIDSQYDLIWCGSLFTHLDSDNWLPIIRLFCDHLNVSGVLVFSAHGRYVAKRIESREKTYGLGESGIRHLLLQYAQSGFGYSDYPKSESYGISISKPSWIMGLVEKLQGLSLLCFYERGWVKHQDLVAFVKE